jgi:hypothetical protein
MTTAPSPWREWSDRLAQIDPPFRGGIAENCRRFRFEGDLYVGDGVVVWREQK